MSPANKGKDYQIDPYTRDEVEALIQASSPRFFASCRTRVMLALMWRTGIRVGECCSAELHDLRLDQGDRPDSLRVQRPKGVKRGKPPREVGIDPVAREYLDVWLRLRGNAPGYLFPTRQGNKLDTSHLRRALPKLAQQAGLTRRAHAHAFRHTFCREFQDEEGVKAIHLMEGLGHSSLGVTTTYAKSCGGSPAVAIMAKRAL
jgi:integrase